MKLALTIIFAFFGTWLIALTYESRLRARAIKEAVKKLHSINIDEESLRKIMRGKND